MDKKLTKTSYISSITTRQQTAVNSYQAATSSSTTSSNVRPYQSPYRTDAVNSSTISSATRSSSQYQSVYNRTTSGTSSGSFARNSLSYSSLQNRPVTYTGRAIAATGQRLHSTFGTSNNEARALPSPSYARPPSGSVQSTELRPASSAVTRDARPFGSPANNVSSSLAGSPALDHYDLTKKGYVVIFHHKYFKNDKALIRDGSEKDLMLLKEFFSKYRVEKPVICQDYTVEKLKKKMAEISNKKFQSYSCLIIIVMSHGETKDRIQAYDAMYNFEDVVVERVLMNETLKDKPKLFFIQACKGNALMDTDVTPSATNKNDMIKCYSTYEGTVSLRNKQSGTYFIQSLFELIEEHRNNDVSEIMVLIRRKFAADRIPQAPTDTTTMMKKFFFADLRKSK